jgi:hypothetical protein
MRLLLTVDSVGGVWQYGLDLARALVGHDVETVLAHLGPSPTDVQRAEARAVPAVTYVETGLPLDWLCDGPAPVLAAGGAIGELAQAHGVDLVQLNMPTLAAAAPPGVPVLAVTHGCVATWWQAAKGGEPLAAEYRWHRRLTSEGLHSADLVVAPTLAYARMVARTYGLRRMPTPVYNGRALAAPPRAAAHDCAFTAGRLWDRVKNTALLDRVAGHLAVPFHAAGPAIGPHGETVVMDNLHHLGVLDGTSLGRRLGSQPVFVSAASFEPFGLAVLEAAAAGCPLVLSDIPTFRELWDGAALFVGGEDPRDWALAIDGIIADGALRQQLCATARERAHRYGPAAAAAAMVPLYTGLIAARRPGGKVAA